VVVNKYGALV